MAAVIVSPYLCGLGYRDLAERLIAMGITEGTNERNIANKISRGSFTAAFFLQCMAAIGCYTLRLDNLPSQAMDVTQVATAP